MRKEYVRLKQAAFPNSCRICVQLTKSWPLSSQYVSVKRTYPLCCSPFNVFEVGCKERVLPCCLLTISSHFSN